MSDRRNQGAQVPQGIMARVRQGVKYVISGVYPNSWFSPEQPTLPVAQEVKGRQFDYQVGINIDHIPGHNEKAVGFWTLRRLADSYDLMRLAIETRKDQIERLNWVIAAKDKTDNSKVDKIKEIHNFFQVPDGYNNFSTWLRALVEDLLVIDAPCLYARMTRGGKLHALELMDGATMKVLITNDGRRPLPPSPAFQQVLYGVPAVDYSDDEIIYRPRNVRTNKIYGFSIVEQIIITVNIALRRQDFQLEYYTSGSVPDMLIGVPPNWSVDQIDQFQQYFDNLLSGNLANRRKAKFYPGDMKPTPTKEPALKDDYDEWLARIICYAFGLSPQSLTKQMNRASAETQQEMSDDEGLAPIKRWVEHLINYIITKYFQEPGIIFKWQEEVDSDVQKQAELNDKYIRNGVKSVDEVRHELGMPPIGMKNAVYGSQGVVFVSDLISGNVPEKEEKETKPARNDDEQTKKEIEKIINADIETSKIVDKILSKNTREMLKKKVY